MLKLDNLKRIFTNFLILLWRIWYYFIFILSVTVMFPVLLVVTSKEKYYSAFYFIARNWGKFMLFAMGFTLKIEELQKVEKEKSYMFIANHTSMIDIMVMFAVVKNPLVFVGKEELTKLPLFGSIFKRTSVTVNRGSAKSRREAFNKAQQKLKRGFSICIFPEGLVPSDESVVLSEFKSGAFRLAIEHKIPIVPMVFFDCKKRFSYTFFSGSPGILRVKVHKFINTQQVSLQDKNKIREQAFNLLYTDLSNDQKNEKPNFL